MPEKKESFSLFELAHTYLGELSRVFSLRNKGKDHYPPENPEPTPIQDWLDGFTQANLNPFADGTIHNYYREILGDENTPASKLDPRRIANIFPSSETICLIASPFDHAGLPSDDVLESFKLARVWPNGFTLDFMGDPGYYFLFLPREIQQQCLIEIPDYQNPQMPSLEEIKQLRKTFFAALDRQATLYQPLEKLISPQKK